MEHAKSVLETTMVTERRNSLLPTNYPTRFRSASATVRAAFQLLLNAQLEIILMHWSFRISTMRVTTTFSSPTLLSNQSGFISVTDSAVSLPFRTLLEM